MIQRLAGARQSQWGLVLTVIKIGICGRRPAIEVYTMQIASRLAPTGCRM